MTTTKNKVKRSLGEYEHQDIVREFEFLEKTLWDLEGVSTSEESSVASFVIMIRDRFNNLADDVNFRLKVYDDLEKSK